MADRDRRRRGAEPSESQAALTPEGEQGSPPQGFQPTTDPAPAGNEAGPVRTAHDADRAWDLDDPQLRHPGVESDRLGAGFDPRAVGDETGDASSPRPDENVADEIAAEVGVPIQDSEELEGSVEKLSERDSRRWELNPASSEDYPERIREEQPGWEDGENLPPL